MIIRRYDFIFSIWYILFGHSMRGSALESYDFSEKTIILFVTSEGSGFGKTVEKLKKVFQQT
ncbi:flavodoxin [Lutispora thermophila]|uniref:flavodoxin n=1 Tax=Lutispora thermophila TaxID=288966 RepID=UPI000934BCD2|nr:flavodoxin [Lutispora thermophila]